MSTVAVVTGANQGLGLALVRGLCRRLGERGVVYLTARDHGRGQAAVRQLAAEGLSPQLHLLDVSDDGSVEALARTMADRHGRVDIVISNAAARISPEVSAEEQVRDFVNTNNQGTHRMITTFGPLLADGGRFVVIASSFGSSRNLPPHLRGRFDGGNLTLGDVQAAMEEYVQLVEAGIAADRGWPDWINIPSKVGQVAAMRAFARAMEDEAAPRDLLINAACPGLVDTDASRPWFDDMSAAQRPDEAAADVLWLATLPSGRRQPYGELVQHGRVIR